MNAIAAATSSGQAAWIHALFRAPVSL